MTTKQKVATGLFVAAAIHTAFMPLGFVLTVTAGAGVILTCLGIVLLIP